MEQLLHDFITMLRMAGVRISISESIDAFDTVDYMGIMERDILKDALSCVLSKSASEKEIFSDCFDRFFAMHPLDVKRGASSPMQQQSGAGGDGLSEMLLSGDMAGMTATMNMAASLENIAGIRYPTQRNMFTMRVLRRMGIESVEDEIRRLKMDAAPGAAERAADLEQARNDLADSVRDIISNRLDLTTRYLQDESIDDYLRHAKLNYLEQKHLQRLQVIIQRLVKQLKDIHSRRRSVARRGQLDFKKTLRRSLACQGFMFDTRWKTKKIDRPEIIAICDVSRSVLRVVRFFLLFLFGLNKSIINIRSFIFCSNLVEATPVFEKYPVDEALARLQSGADLPILMGRTDYDCSFRDFRNNYLDAVTRKTTVIILGDARNNYSGVDVGPLKAISGRCKRLIWLNPEIPAYWGTGDSEIKKYTPHCHIVQECNTLNHLERLVSSLLRVH